MIKTLRITSIIAAVAAVILLALPAVYGVRSDPKIEEFLKAECALDKFAAARGQRLAGANTQVSPLVKQAADFARYLNPPPPPPPPPSETTAAAAPAPAAPVSVKFDLLGVSYFALHPEQSFALIDEPGKGLYWIKQGSSVGHLVIEKIGDGTIIIRDGQKTSEMAVKVDESWKTLLKDSGSAPNAQPAAGPAAARSPATPGKPASRTVPVRPNVRDVKTDPAAARRRPTGPPQTGRMGLQPASSQTPASPEQSGGANPAVAVPPQSQPVTPAEATIPPMPPVAEQQSANEDVAVAPPPPPSEKDLIKMRLAEQVKAQKITPDEAKKLEEIVQTLEQLDEIERQRASEQH